MLLKSTQKVLFLPKSTSVCDTSASFTGTESLITHKVLFRYIVNWSLGMLQWVVWRLMHDWKVNTSNRNYNSCLPTSSQHSVFSVWTCLVYCVSWRHAAWLFYWSLVLKCGCSKSCELAAIGTRLWLWELCPILGAKRLITSLYSLSDSCLYCLAPGTARLCRPYNEAQGSWVFAAQADTHYLL